MFFIFFIRSAFFLLFSFEFLNSIKIFNISLHFPWGILTGITLFSWLIWEKIFKIEFSLSKILGGFIIFQLYANSLGNTFKFYTQFEWYDELTHFTGGALAGFLAFLTLKYLQDKKKISIGPKSLIVWGTSLALFAGVIFEFFEYIAQNYFGFPILGNANDVVEDLAFDLLGGAIAVSFLTLIFRKSSTSGQRN